VQTLIAGDSTQKGSGSVVAKKVRAEGTAYVVVNVEQHSAKYVGALVDVIEVGAAQTGLVTVSADAIGKGIAETGRVVLDGIFFDYDKASLQPQSKAAFDAIAQYLKANPARNFYVVGHTDSRGTFAYNSKLSDDRARAVADKLIKDYAIASSRLEPHGVGPLNPVFSNGSDAGREKNRRVELVERLN
jgi:outer membrane protein OmpA-like peptidoglycan-associated protein